LGPNPLRVNPTEPMLELNTMQPLKARVENGQIIVEDKAELPNGEIYVLPVTMEQARTAELDEELALSLRDEEAGDLVDFDAVMADLGRVK
jgi:hypothetical protein